ncbi:dihydrofolate reductase family protein [Arthrobacter mobilis]|uniref:Dihydrofolate reductase family protein n=1 Tax=Arthrobacter mobilis TaxID=2724944 RepID=A0A7X6K621_9MICC|nr:dihydrofolate reductase family protein [Arthrobacter mobilis]NKX54233.1 dihydrofolate reductase family protein [Arthrobacter mobilis]
MGKLLVQQIVSMDGFAAAPDGSLDFFGRVKDWHAINDANRRLLEDCSAILLGRVTYGMFSDYWPKADPQEESVAGPINRLPKYVVSSTLEKAPWGDDGEARIISGDAAGIRSLLEREPGNVIVWGSLQLTDLLFRERLVDELQLHVVPAAIGAGLAACPPAAAQVRFSLVSSEQLAPDMLATRYAVE